MKKVPFKFIIIYLATKIKNIIYKSYNNKQISRLIFKSYNNKKISETWSRNLDENELAAEKIVKLWENLDNNKLSKPSNWRMYHCLLRVLQIKDTIGKYLRKLQPVKFSNFREDFKFSPLEKKDISNRITRFQNTL